MNKKLRDSFNAKMDLKPSKDFDSTFFAKLEKSDKKPNFFSNWITWAVSGCATASVLFIAVTNYSVPNRSLVHQEEYIQSLIEVQDTLNEGIGGDDLIDLTTSSTDAI